MKIGKSFFLFITCLLILPAAAMAGETDKEDSPLKKGSFFPETGITLPKADVLIIQIFSMYCPHCQKEAPALNDFYEKIEADPLLRDRIKLIGIGAGNSEYEVDFFRKKYDVRFPLFPDADFAIHRKIGEVRTPYFVGVTFAENGKPLIFHSHLGGIGTPEEFLDSIIKESGMKQGGEK
ncbi:MAG: TlpA disulfide reductase family protein [Desulfobacterales bacterium]